MTTQPLDLDAIEARANAAAKGPWGFYDGDNYADIAADLTVTGRGSYSYRQKIARLEDEDYWDDPAHENDDDSRAQEQMAANAAFIAHAREDVPAMAAEIRRLRARVAQALADAFTSDGQTTQGMRVAEEDPEEGPGVRRVRPWEAADAIMPVLPAPTDRAAVLREAAAQLDAAAERQDDLSSSDYDQESYAAFQLRDQATALRRMADGAQPDDTVHTCPGRWGGTHCRCFDTELAVEAQPAQPQTGEAVS